MAETRREQYERALSVLDTLDRALTISPQFASDDAVVNGRDRLLAIARASLEAELEGLVRFERSAVPQLAETLPENKLSAVFRQALAG